MIKRFTRLSEKALEEKAAEIKRLLKGGISEILAASSICEQANFELVKESLALLIETLNMSPSQFKKIVGIYRIQKYGEGHTANLPTKRSVLYFISAIPHPVIEDVLKAEIFTQRTTLRQVRRVAKEFYCKKFRSLGVFRFRNLPRGKLRSRS